MESRRMSSPSGRIIDEYEPIIGRSEMQEILELAERVHGARIIHVNSTMYGGGVAEMLRSLVPLANSLGLKVKWEVIEGDDSFFKTTKSIHNALQGNMNIEISEEMWSHYLEVNEGNVRKLDLEGDVILIHDPQPLPLILHRRGGVWVWRCHVDMSSPHPDVWARIREYVLKYDALVFSLERYAPGDVLGKPVYTRFPAIDPLSDKNRSLSVDEILRVLERYDVDPDRPLIGQVARFDPWKRPLDALKAYRLAREKIPGLQMAMVGSFAHDDPEGEEWYRKVKEEVGDDGDIHLLTNLKDVEVNAVQRSLSVALQMSIREGFGLSVTEALWKEVPVIARRAGGIPLQVIDGFTGFLIESPEEAAERAVYLIKRPWMARELGARGHDHVKRSFIITKLLKDYLRMHIDLVGLAPEIRIR